MNATWLTLFKIAGGDVIAVIVHFLYNILKSERSETMDGYIRVKVKNVIQKILL